MSKHKKSTKSGKIHLVVIFISLLGLIFASPNPGNAFAHSQQSEKSSVSPFDGWPVIASIEQAGNDADEAVEFSLEDCTVMRLFATGEVSGGRMVDYGTIEHLDTGQEIWRMYYFETDSNGSAINRHVNRTFTLPAGSYRLRFHTNDSHSYNDWGQQQPVYKFWGIALYQEMSAGQPTPGCWEYAHKPEDLGWSSSQLARLEPVLEDMNAAALMIVTDGQIVYQWGNIANNFMAHSMRKSLMSALYGIAVANGEIDLSKTLADLNIDDKVPLTEEEKQATVSDLLQARSGVYIPAAGEAASMKQLRPPRGSHPHGTFWYYNNWDFNALGTIFDQENEQENIYQAFKDWIADPIGMQDLDIGRLFYDYEPQSIHPYYGFRISARDLARFGQLYLQQGSWHGAQIIPTAWVEESVIPYSHTGDSGTYSGYGYMWWVAAEDHWAIPQGTFAASGYGGHTMEVVPDLNTVIVLRINTDDPDIPLVSTSTVERLMIDILRASNHKQTSDPYDLAYLVLIAWGALTALSLAVLIWRMAHDTHTPSIAGWAWVVVTVAFGPLGLLVYCLVGRQQVRQVPGLRVLAASFCCATGNILGVLLLYVGAIVSRFEGNVGLLALLVPFTTGWLICRTPLFASRTRRSYLSALPRTFLTEVMSTMLVIAGVLPVSITLERLWFPYTYQLDSPLFWAMNLLAVLIGALIVFPLNLWMVHRGFPVWPFLASQEGRPQLPALRRAWGALLVSLVVMVAMISVVI
jgi:CubicO group peptidase (beta-lactamase class C family)